VSEKNRKERTVKSIKTLLNESLETLFAFFFHGVLVGFQNRKERARRTERAIQSKKTLLVRSLQSLRRFTYDGKWGRLFVLLTLLSILVGLAVSQTTVKQNLSSSGAISVIGVEVYSNAACTNKVTSIAWGTLVPGTSVSKTIYVRNPGTTVETLSMTYGNWTPTTAASFFSLSWNCTNHSIASGGVVGAKLTLTVQSTITGVTDFGYSITIQGTV
jgi:hypothetical protein